MPNIFSGADAHVAQRIADTPVSLAPFQHCVVDNVFPAELFAAIHDNWPSDDVMKSLPDTGRTSSYKERYVMLLNDEFIHKLSEQQAQFWHSMLNVACGAAVIRSCFAKFQGVLLPRIQHLKFEDVYLESEMLVISDRDNYAIGPHTDTKGRFISLLYYLSEEPEYASYGTGLYEPLQQEMAVKDNAHYTFKDFKLHTRVDYKPNRVVAFPRSDRSFHGVKPVPVENCDRRLIIVNIKAPQGAV